MDLLLGGDIISVLMMFPYYLAIGVLLLAVGYKISRKAGRWRKYCSIALLGFGIVLLIMAALSLIFVPSDVAPIPYFIAYENIERAYDSSTNTSWISNTTWTVVSQSDVNPLKSNVIVTIRNASGYLLIENEFLLSASGTHGFNYTATSDGEYVSYGDKFILDWAIYAQGSNLTLMDGDSRLLWGTVTE